jgi:hypothetical protein
MFIINATDATLTPLVEYAEHETGGHITAVIKKVHTIGADGSLSPYPHDQQPEFTGEVQHADDLGRSLRYPGDIAAYKPFVDVILNATACAPGGQAVPELEVTLNVAGRRKRVRVVGEREWYLDDAGAWGISEPEPFREMPLRWEKSFGALDDPRNPMGKGGGPDPLSDPEEPRYPLPNIEDPERPIQDPADSPDPVNLGPVARDWQARDRKRGTRDMFWATFRAPDLPKDYDPAFENAAPDDQQFEHLVGDEAIWIDNVDPAQPTRRLVLPGMRPRLFYVRRDDAARELVEFPVALDTVVIDLDAGEVSLVWRGQLNHSFDLVENHLAYFYLQEDTTQPPSTPVETYQEHFEKDKEPFERAFEAEAVTSEQIHDDVFARIMEQAVQTLGECKLDDETISAVKKTTDAESMRDVVQATFDAKAEEARKMMDRLKKGMPDGN